jgi:phosphatidylinositol alpha-1,6-mannosyltransferase
VVYPSVAPAPGPAGEGTEVLEKYGLEKPYLLYVGNFKPHKNIDRLVSAFGILPQEIKDVYKLLLVGGSRQEVDDMRRSICERGLSGKIIPVANMGNTEVRLLLKNAEMFVFPSLAEGFGIPPVEAMASGVPVASSNLAPMTEVLADAALYFDPNDPEDISRSILKLLQEKELREKCIKKGLERSSVFNPEDMSLKIMDVLENAGAEKTLCVSSEFPPVMGGIATHIYSLWGRIDKKEICVFTARPSGAGSRADETLDIIREFYPLGRDMLSRVTRVIMVSWHMFRQNNVRKIRRNHCAQVLSAGLGGLLVKKLKGTPYVVYTYSADILEFSRNFLTLWIMKKVFSESEHVIANSVFTKSLVTGHGLAPKDKITVSTPGVDTEIFDPARGDGGIREKYGIKGKRKMVLTVARLAARKGHENVLTALSDVVRSYPELTYVIVGEGPMRSALESLVKEKGLEKNVIFAGEMPLEKLVFFYNACDVFVMTPRYIKEEGDVEGFGIVFLEANACGKPVIAGKSGGVTEAVIDGETGFLVAPENTEEIRDAMLKLLGDEGLAKELGARGLKRVRAEFNWASRVEELKEYI